MQKKIFVLSAIVLVVVAAFLFFILKPAVTNGDNAGLGKISQNKTDKETTIRNVTEETLYYTVEYVGRAGEPEERILEVGAIDRFPGTFDIDVTFIKDGEP